MSNNPSQQLVALLREFAHASDRYVESTGALHGTHRTDMNALSIIMKYQLQGTPPSTSGSKPRAAFEFSCDHRHA
jgi:hypothetical protein